MSNRLGPARKFALIGVALILVSACGDQDLGIAAGASSPVTDLLTPSPIPQTPPGPTPTRGPLPTPTPLPTPPPPMTVIPTPPPPPTQYGIAYAQPNELPAISEAEALAIVMQRGGSSERWSQANVSVIYVLLSMGSIQNHPVWIVTEHAVCAVPSVPGALPGMTPPAIEFRPVDANSVIDAMTGKFLAGFSTPATALPKNRCS